MSGNGDGLDLLSGDEGGLVGLTRLIRGFCGRWVRVRKGIEDNAVNAAAGFDEGEAEIGFESGFDGVGVAFGEIEGGIEFAGNGGFIDDRGSEGFFKAVSETVERGLDHGEFIVHLVVEADASMLGRGGTEQGGGFGSGLQYPSIFFGGDVAELHVAD